MRITAGSAGPAEPEPDDAIDPDAPARPAGPEWDVLAVVAAGGVIGAECRLWLGDRVPHTAAQLPWSTVAINVIGCLLIGVLMVVLTEFVRPHRLARPFLGIGILGGFTTFSTFSVDAVRLLHAHRPGAALLYVAVTLVGGSVAVATGTALTRRAGARLLDRSAPPAEEVAR